MKFAGGVKHAARYSTMAVAGLKRPALDGLCRPAELPAALTFAVELSILVCDVVDSKLCPQMAQRKQLLCQGWARGDSSLWAQQVHSQQVQETKSCFVCCAKAQIHWQILWLPFLVILGSPLFS